MHIFPPHFCSIRCPIAHHIINQLCTLSSYEIGGWLFLYSRWDHTEYSSRQLSNNTHNSNEMRCITFSRHTYTNLTVHIYNIHEKSLTTEYLTQEGQSTYNNIPIWLVRSNGLEIMPVFPCHRQSWRVYRSCKWTSKRTDTRHFFRNLRAVNLPVIRPARQPVWRYHYCLWRVANTKLYCFVTEAHVVCERLTQGSCRKTCLPWVRPADCTSDGQA